MNLDQLLAIPRARAPEHPAVVSAPPQAAPTRLTYGELLAAAEAWADHLRARGVRPGDRVAFYVGNRPEMVIAILAVLRLGAVLVPLNLAYRQREIDHILSDARPRLLVTEGDVLERIEDLVATLPVLPIEELPDPTASPRPAPELPRVEGSDLAMLLYTSGTTGQSKGARLSHDNVLATVTSLLAAWAWEPTDVLLLALPLFHAHGLLVGLMTSLAAGATIELHRRFDAPAVADRLVSGEVTLFFGVPTMYRRLLDELAGHRDRRGLASMRLFCSGSAPLPAELFAAFRDRTGHEILERYGMTEAGMILSNLYAGPRRPGTVGTPLPGVSVRLVDGDGEEVPDGTDGELVVRGAAVVDGYWEDRAKSRQSVHADGEGRLWFRTGDLACRDPESGAITLLGRRHELILSGGYNIYPREVEEALLGLPGVAEAAVVGRPHPEWGEVPVAFVVPEGALEEAAVIAALKEQLAGYKVPRTYRLVDALPRNALGKIQKHRLPE